MDDKYTKLVLEGSEYELLRARRGMLSRWSIPQKVRGCSYLLFASSAMLPLTYFLPASVRKAYVGVEPANSRVAFTALALLSVGCLLVSSLGLAATAAYRNRLADVSEDQAWTLVGIEGLFSGVGYVTGLLGVAATLVLSGIGYAGVETIDALVAAGVDPYHPNAGLAVPVFEASAIAFYVAVGVFLLGSFLESLE